MEPVVEGGGGHRSSGGSPLVFTQLAERDLVGSPTVPSTPSDVAFANHTVYSPIHRALSPDELMAILGPTESFEWEPIKSSGLACVDGRHRGAACTRMVATSASSSRCRCLSTWATQIEQAETTRLLEGWLTRLRETGGTFVCIASAAVQQFLAVGSPSLADDAEQMSSPEEACRTDAAACAPDFVGNEHMKWLLQFSQTYATRAPRRAVRTLLLRHPVERALSLRQVTLTCRIACRAGHCARTRGPLVRGARTAVARVQVAHRLDAPLPPRRRRRPP